MVLEKMGRYSSIGYMYPSGEMKVLLSSVSCQAKWPIQVTLKAAAGGFDQVTRVEILLANAGICRRVLTIEQRCWRQKFEKKIAKLERK